MKTFATLSLFSLALAANAADFAADYNLATNPGTTGWTYGYTTTLGGTLNVHTQFNNAATVKAWYTNGLSGDQTPSVFKYAGTSGNGVALGEAGLHGGPSGEFAVARWTATAAGGYNVAGAFGQGDSGNVDVYVRKGGASLFSVLSTYNAQAFSLQNVAFAAGESIDFVVGIAGDYRFDSTPLAATINPVPEPASLAALGAGVLALVRRRAR